MRFLEKVKMKIYGMIFKQIVPPTYDVKRYTLLEYANIYKINILVETGTFLGDTVEYFKNRFSEVFSIELADELARKAKIRFQNDKNVTIIHGDSGVELFTLVRNFSSPVLFWLDGHYSSEFQLGDTYIITAKSEKDTPIENELKAILSSNLNHIVLIDDARLFNGTNDYPSFRHIKMICRSFKPNYRVEIKEDIIRLFPNP
jgi:hypothetical protein